MNREDVVRAALMAEGWCAEHYEMGACDCPFARGKYCKIHVPRDWGLEEFLRNRGMKHEDEDVTG